MSSFQRRRQRAQAKALRDMTTKAVRELERLGLDEHSARVLFPHLVRDTREMRAKRVA